MVYFVNASNVTPDEPSPGWYYAKEDEDGNADIVGPFQSKREALDDMSDGAYSEWENDKRTRDRDADYRRDMIDAGRGHLLRDTD